MDANSHAPISPSGLHVLVQCPGSLKLRRQSPPEALLPEEAEDGGDAAAEGVAAHWGLAQTLLGKQVDLGMEAPNGVRLTDEMLDAVDLAHSAILQHAGDAALAVESPVAIPRIHAECWGTPDVRWWRADKHLFVFDFKFGHEPVEVFENWQLLAYAAGAWEQAGLHDLDVTVTAGVIQPRAQHREGPLRTWTFRASAVRALLNIVSGAAHEALGPDPKLRVGPACKHCRARPVCPAIAQAAGNASDLAHQALPHALTPEAVGVELRHAQRALLLLKARAAALEEQALALARSGKNVPNFTVEHAPGRERWEVSDNEVIALGQMLGLDLAKPAEALTPLQASKRGLPDALRQKFARRQTGAAELVPDDGSNARRIFGA